MHFLQRESVFTCSLWRLIVPTKLRRNEVLKQTTLLFLHQQNKRKKLTNINDNNLSFDVTDFTKRSYRYPRQSISSFMAALVTLLANPSSNVDYNLFY